MASPDQLEAKQISPALDSSLRKPHFMPWPDHVGQREVRDANGALVIYSRNKYDPGLAAVSPEEAKRLQQKADSANARRLCELSDPRY